VLFFGYTIAAVCSFLNLAFSDSLFQKLHGLS
jgi:hypothetical protein